MRRIFNQRERNEIYRNAEGLCENCCITLGDDWEADHRVPFSAGGPTTVENGQALCGLCNRKKGARMPDKFEPRPFQKSLCDTVMAKIAAGERVTVAYVSAGSGKTKGWLHTANTVWRSGRQLDGVAVYVPRQNLRNQAETDSIAYLRDCSAPKINKIMATANVDPLVRADRFGYSACYQSVVSGSKLHKDWAKEHAGRFILILDEAQFVGLGDEDGGTKVARHVEEIAGYALHTIVLTATPTRSDGNPIALATYDEPNENGERRLKFDVRASYTEGVGRGYLRPCIFELENGNGVFSDESDFDLSSLENRLSGVLEHPEIWQPMVDRTVAKFLERRAICPEYRCLIAATRQQHARDILAYLKARHRQFLSVLAVSDEADPGGVMDNFRDGVGDILVTVAMAYIGWDCPSVSVVGVLTNKRWAGWLEQLIMRAGRMWDKRPRDEQHMIVVGPNDPALRKFADKFRSDSDAGLRERKDGPPITPPTTPSSVSVISGSLTDQHYLGFTSSQDISGEEWAGIAAFAEKLSTAASRTPPTTIAEILRQGGLKIPTAPPIEQPQDCRTDDERRRAWDREEKKVLIEIIRHRFGVSPRDQGFEIHIAKFRTNLNKMFGVPNSRSLTDEQWGGRLRVVNRWLDECREVAT